MVLGKVAIVIGSGTLPTRPALRTGSLPVAPFLRPDLLFEGGAGAGTDSWTLF